EWPFARLDRPGRALVRPTSRGGRAEGKVSEIRVFGVIGAGQMGAGIAQVAAQTGLEVKLLDASPELAKKGRDGIGKQLARAVEKAKMTKDEADAVLARIAVAASYADLATCDIVVEAATENPEIKNKIFEAA